MHKLKTLILALAISLVGINLLSVPTHADMGTACADAGFSDPLLCGTSGQNEEAVIQQKVANVLNQVYLWIGIVAVVVIVISGIRYMTSQGNAESIKKAKAGILYATIGLVVVLAAFAITLVITNAIQGNQVNTSDASGSPSGGGGGEGGGGGGGAPTPEVIEVDYIRINPASIKLEVGQTAKLTASIVPDYATNKTITFESSSPSVATINTSGTVTAIAEGTTTITAKSNNGKTATATVEVTKTIEPESVEITSNINTIIVGKTATLTAKVSPDNAKNKSLTWSSNKPQILTVNSNTGSIKGIKPGEATITVKTFNNKTATVKITVTDSSVTKVKKLQDTVKTYAWPSYKGSGYRNQISAYTSAYNSAANSFVSNHDCKGDDCGVFVLITMRNSGWEPNYPNQRTGGQYEWLNNPANGWEDVTNKIKSNADAKPGDVIITRGTGHVLMYVGDIEGFGSKMASASYCSRSPMADGSTDIMSYINNPHSNGKRYAVFRKKNI